MMIEDPSIEIRVETPLNNTESLEKVEKAITTLFFDAECKIEEGGIKRKVYAKLRGKSALSILYNSFRNQKILDAARRMMYKGLIGDTFIIYFNKQAAFIGKIHFSLVDEETRMLGPIKVIVKSNNIEDLIDYLAPETNKGKIME